MNSRLLIRRALCTCLTIAIFATYSMIALAGPERIAGEITVTGNGMNGDTPSVMVNGEPARSGRSIFSSSIIVTPSNASALLNLGKNGIFELAPGTTFTVSFDDKSVNGDLTAGKLTVLGTSVSVNVKTSTGKILQLTGGESINADGNRDDDDDNHKSNNNWLIWVVILGGAAAVLLAVAAGSNKSSVGGSGGTVSPVR